MRLNNAPGLLITAQVFNRRVAESYNHCNDRAANYTHTHKRNAVDETS